MIEAIRTGLLLRELRRGVRRTGQQQRDLQSRLLRAAVIHAESRVPFYRRVWAEAGVAPGSIASIDDLERLPIITPARVAAAMQSDELRARGARASHGLFPTSGSSGEARYVPRGAVEARTWRAGGLRMLFEHGFGWRDSVLQLDAAPAPPHPLQRLGVARSIWISPELPLEEQLDRITARAARFVVGTPTRLRHLCRALEQRRIQVSRAAAVLCQGEILDRESSEIIRRTFGTEPLSTYGATELGYVAWQCERRADLHVNSDLVAVEILDEHARPAAAGALGRVVITDLRGRTMPMLRWESGDLATAPAAPCPCGRTLPTIGVIDGRASQTLHLAGGRRLTPRAILDAMAGFLPIDDYRLTQDSASRFRLTTRPAAVGADAIAGAASELRRLLGEVELEVETSSWPVGVEKTHVVHRT